jgi:hypothetical protein
MLLLRDETGLQIFCERVSCALLFANIFEKKVKVKVNFSLEQAMNAQSRCRGIDLLFI